MRRPMERYPHEEPRYELSEMKDRRREVTAVLVPIPTRATCFKSGVLFGVFATSFAELALYMITHF